MKQFLKTRHSQLHYRRNFNEPNCVLGILSCTCQLIIRFSGKHRVKEIYKTLSQLKKKFPNFPSTSQEIVLSLEVNVRAIIKLTTSSLKLCKTKTKKTTTKTTTKITNKRLTFDCWTI